MVIDRHRHKCPRMPVIINEDVYTVLIDTGAELSCMSREMYESLNKQKSLPTLPVCGVTIVGATGSKSRKVGIQAFVKMIINEMEIEFPFLVVEGLVIPLLLGADILSEYRAVIDFEKGRVSFSDKEGEMENEENMATSEEEKGSVIGYVGIGIMK
jgi:predicted aspartyl protease